jgi:hypothetical protein
MNPDRTQRWRDRRDSFRQRGEAFRPGDYGVEVIPDDRTARGFVERHHYSASYPAARLRVGLFRRAPFAASELVGVAVFSVGVQPRSVPAYAPGLTAGDGVDLGRLVLLDDVPFNGETWFLARAFEALRAEFAGVRVVLSYSDPQPRITAEGATVMPGHVGVIYQAKGARYVGRTRGEWQHLDRFGRVLSRRTLDKIRLEERGAAAAYRDLVDLGAPVRQLFEEPRDYVARALRDGPFRRVRHPGQHVYLFAPSGTAAGLPPTRAAAPFPRKAA